MIRILDPKVASQIAAGEVVERPASVVKELVENAIDSGAQEIKVEVRGGGQRLVRVIDDGSGIPAGEVEIAFQRHATSKLASTQDLLHITTLGFRGEALPSIASVAKVTMLSRPRDQPEGAFLQVEGGKVAAIQKRGAPVGTVVTMNDLFYNIPARRKFLRQESTENGHITDLVVKYALAYPQIRFILLVQGKTVFRSSGSGSLSEVLAAAMGTETAKSMLPITEQSNGLSVSGFVGPPSLHRANARHIILLVNSRWVRDQSLVFAIREAYYTLLPTGRYPMAVVRVDLPPEEVDVNVHPTKNEVRFRKAGEVFTAVQRAIRHALTAAAPIPEVSRPLATIPADAERRKLLLAAGQEGISPASDQLTLQEIAPVVAKEIKVPPLRVLGQLAQTYIISEGPVGMYLIDQHAAHERVLYERLLAEQREQGINSQGLLEPLSMELSPAEAAAIDEHEATLAQYGFAVEPFGGQTFLLRAVPAVLINRDPVKALHNVLDEASLNAGRWEEAFVISLACHSAVRAGEVLGEMEMRDLVQQLEETESPRTCPHGRPTIILMRAEQLAKEFGRR